MNREVTIREGEEVKKITMQKAILLAQANTAMKGNPIAQRDVEKLAMECARQA